MNLLEIDLEQDFKYESDFETNNIVKEYNEAKKDFENYEEELLNYYTLDLLNDIKLNYNLYLESKIKAHKQYAKYYEKYIDVKENYDEYIQLQMFSDSNNKSDSNLNLMKEYIEKKQNDLSVYNSVDLDYEYKLIEISNKLNKYANKYDLYIFTCIIPMYISEILEIKNFSYNFVVSDKFKFETIKKIVPNIFARMLNGDKFKFPTANGNMSEIQYIFCYYDDIKNKEIIDETLIKMELDNNKYFIHYSDINKISCEFIEKFGLLNIIIHKYNSLYPQKFYNKYKFSGSFDSIDKIYKIFYKILLKIYENILFYEKINFDINFLQDLSKKMNTGNISVYDYYKEINGIK